jgi:pyrroloquinoline quinone biosynthesis protein E
MHPDPDADMTVADVERMVAELPGLESVALQVNGEPLLHRDLASIVSVLTTRGVRVELNTNAIAFPPETARALVAAGLHTLNVSVDGVEARTYAQLRGVDALHRVVENTRRFLEIRGPAPASPAVWLWMVASRHNLTELPGLVDLAVTLGVDGLYLQRLVFFGEGLARPIDSVHGRLSERDRETIARAEACARDAGLALAASGGHGLADMLSASSELEPQRACRRPFESAVVMADGEVVPCCISTFVAPRASIAMGNVLERGWEAVWAGEPYRHFRRDLREGELPAPCRRCGVDWSL